MSECKDCGHQWNIHEPIGFCTGNASAYDQCGCDSIPDGTWFTVDSLAAALHATGVGCPYDTHWHEQKHDASWHGMHAAAIIKAAKEASE